MRVILSIIFLSIALFGSINTYDISVNPYNENPISSKKGFKSFYSNGNGYMSFSPYIISTNNDFSFLETKIQIQSENTTNNIFLDRISYLKIKKSNSNKLAFYDIDYTWKFNIGTDFEENKYSTNFINIGIGDNIEFLGDKISYFVDFTAKENEEYTNLNPILSLEYTKENFNTKVSYSHNITNEKESSYSYNFVSLDFFYKINDYKNIYYSLSQSSNNAIQSIGFLINF